MRGAIQTSPYYVLQVSKPFNSSQEFTTLRGRTNATYETSTVNLGPRYLHSTGQLHKGEPEGVVGVLIVQPPTSTPVRITRRTHTFHYLHLAQAISECRAMTRAGRPVWQSMVDDFDEAAKILGN
jgi:hypothetical protein